LQPAPFRSGSPGAPKRTSAERLALAGIENPTGKYKLHAEVTRPVWPHAAVDPKPDEAAFHYVFDALPRRFAAAER
jgi:hypothetical protein